MSIKQVSVFIPNKQGALHTITNVLAQANIALYAADSGVKAAVWSVIVKAVPVLLVNPDGMVEHPDDFDSLAVHFQCHRLGQSAEFQLVPSPIRLTCFLQFQQQIIQIVSIFLI